jgi:DNA repair protein RecO (recombination protein O)
LTTNFCKTRGIVLHQVKYSESSLIVKIYTEEYGLKSFIFKGVRKQKHRISPNLFEHLSILELVFNFKEKSDLQIAKEVRLFQPFQTIPFDMRKRSIALFVNELVYKSLKEEEANPELFTFLLTSIQMFDLMTEEIINFHIWFALQLTRQLGFRPMDNYDDQHRIFDLKEGIFNRSYPEHLYFVDYPLSLWFHELSNHKLGECKLLNINNTGRRELVQKIIEYYRLHLQGFQEMKSPAVLEKVLE